MKYSCSLRKAALVLITMSSGLLRPSACSRAGFDLQPSNLGAINTTHILPLSHSLAVSDLDSHGNPCSSRCEFESHRHR